MDLSRLHILALTHHRLPLEAVGRFHMDADVLKATGHRLMEAGLVSECFFITTCNRAELVFMTDGEGVRTEALLRQWRPELDEETHDLALRAAVVHSGADAVRHLVAVASSLESLVIGEREILAQVREHYERSRVFGHTGDGLRLLMKQVVTSAKRVYTETAIANRPVSVVSLAYRALRDHGVRKEARFLIIGAGKTCADMCLYLAKHGFKDLHIFNRTLSKAEALVKEVGGEAYPLDTLVAFDEGFDVIISGIGRGTPLVDAELFATLRSADPRPTEQRSAKPMLVDLAIPHDIDTDCMGPVPAHLIRIEDLHQQADANRAARHQELGACQAIVEEGVAEFEVMARERGVERAMAQVPDAVRALRARAVNEVFATEIARLDPEARAVLDKVLDHLERKYISVPMKLAKQVILDEHQRVAEAPRP
jgi:glutamyl-tRNA reductase